MKKIIVTAAVFGSLLFAQSAQELIKENGCLACHAVASKKAAPAFAGIGKRNKRFEGDNAKATIMNSIKNGSSGKYPMFSDSAMPAFPNFSQEELSTLADYILVQSSKAQCKSKGHGMGQGMGMGRGMR
ncbi:c-type cytochrome [Sulfurimonas sp.]|uniref:c-type cytochrome n=1 Tax=Sulfurimonas sp. TaxID=2022749 RepID=UPI0026325935|nr:cytochrome c [Sulfurimonas sp.]